MEYSPNYAITIDGKSVSTFSQAAGVNAPATELRTDLTSLEVRVEAEFEAAAGTVRVKVFDLDETFLPVMDEDGNFKYVREKTMGLFDSLYDAVNFAR